MADGYHGAAGEGKPAAGGGRRGYGWGVAAALASGLLLALAYPGPGWWPLAWLAWTPLLAWLFAAQPAWYTASAAGALAGTVAFVRVFSFLAQTAVQMAGLSVALGWGIVVLHALAMALHPALAMAWMALAVRRWPRRWGRLAVAAASAVVASEFAVPWLFPLYLGHAFYDAPLWVQAADVFGIVGVSGLCVAVSALLAAAWADARARLRLAAAVLGLLGGWAGYGALRLAQTADDGQGPRWTAVMVQHNPTVAEKRSRDVKVRLAMLDRLERLTLQARDNGLFQGAQAVVWAEGALPFFWVVDPVAGEGQPLSPTRARPHLLAAKARVQALSAQLGLPLLTGTQRHTTAMWTDGGRNSAVLVEAGRPRWHYDKRILLAFGEYLPGSQWFPQLRGAVPGVSDFEAGTTTGLVQFGGAAVLVSICYEALFGGFLRAEARAAAVLVNLTNDVWFGPPPASELHLMVQQPRAVELRRPLLRSTVSGVTAWIGADGRIWGRTAVGQEAVVRATVGLRDFGSPYRWWGDGPVWLLVALVSLACGAVWLDKRKTPWPNTGPPTEGS